MATPAQLVARITTNAKDVATHEAKAKAARDRRPDLYRAAREAGVPIAAIAKAAGISRQAVDRYLPTKVVSK